MTQSNDKIVQLTNLILQNELRDPHSAAYREGLRQAIALRLTGSDISNEFPVGSAEWDAFEAGSNRGLDCTERYMHHQRRETNTFLRIHPDPRRLTQRLARGRALAERIIKDMQAKGMGEAQLIGSMADGTIHEHSDIDILVFDCGSLKPFFVAGEVVDTDCREIGDEGIEIDCIVIEIMVEKERPRWLAMRKPAASESAGD